MGRDYEIRISLNFNLQKRTTTVTKAVHVTIILIFIQLTESWKIWGVHIKNDADDCKSANWSSNRTRSYSYRLYSKQKSKNNKDVIDGIAVDCLWINNKYNLNLTISFEGE